MEKTAILFPGQGSQYVGMGKSLCDQYQTARETMQEASDILGWDMGRLCWEEGMEKLTQTRYTQPAIFTVSVAYYRVYQQEYSLPIQYMAGHSLGEFTALCCSGAMGFADALRLVSQRGIWMEESAQHGLGQMYAVRNITREMMENVGLSELGLSISCCNSPTDTVIAGTEAAFSQVQSRLEELGGSISRLAVSAPFHSPQMTYARERLEAEIKHYRIEMPQVPVLSNVSAKPYESPAQIRDLLVRQMTEPVMWEQSMTYLREQDVTTCIEMGPKTVLKRLMHHESSIHTLSFDQAEDRQQLTVQKQQKQPDGLHLIQQCLANAVATKNRNEDHAEYVCSAVHPYQNIQTLLRIMVSDGREPSLSEMALSLEMLQSVFRTKRTPVEEQRRRLERILQETRTMPFFSDLIPPKEGVREMKSQL
ncbi:ACP S-malonyltransferase [Brevibacillus dissolubilis]|uniref:ACP S-malonyltransferase n=1 Tax=Brevibacillus dissolubilis TaxID=1844116 RepID=UPI0011163E1B|nr:ACP S-malonyltransferase [Brevibacillus dissolubilis]